MVQLSSRFTRNFLEMNLANGSQVESTISLLRHTRLTVGKYLTSRLFLLYSGQFDAWPVANNFSQANVGLRHTFGLEYRFTRDLLLQMEYDYNSLFQTQKDDKRIWLRHSFSIKQD